MYINIWDIHRSTCGHYCRNVNYDRSVQHRTGILGNSIFRAVSNVHLRVGPNTSVHIKATLCLCVCGVWVFLRWILCGFVSLAVARYAPQPEWICRTDWKRRIRRIAVSNVRAREVGGGTFKACVNGNADHTTTRTQTRAHPSIHSHTKRRVAMPHDTTRHDRAHTHACTACGSEGWHECAHTHKHGHPLTCESKNFHMLCSSAS